MLHQEGVESGSPAPSRRSQVLVVDDEPQVLVALEDLLSDDYEVLKASSGSRALELLEAERDVAVVITDQRMPGMTGDELLAKLSARSRATRVMVTGYADLAAVIHAVNRGKIFAYVTKPWESAELRATVRKCVEHFELVQKLAHEQQLLSDLLGNVPDAIYFKDRELRFTRVNRVCAERWGLADPGAAVGKRLHDLGVPAELAAALEQEEAEVLREGRAAADLVRERDEPGGRRFYSSTVAPVRSEEGPPHGLVGISRDVTARVETEHALRRLTHVRTMLGAVNGVIARVREREALLEECCRVAVEEGDLLMGGILLGTPESGSLRVASSYGEHPELVELLAAAAMGERAPGLGLASALASRRPRIASDLKAQARDELVAGLLEAGGAAVALFPLSFNERAKGALVLVARQRAYFDGDEIRLLVELTDNIAFALDHLEKGAKLDFLAYYDQVTGLPKRDLLMDRMQQLLAGRAPDAGRLAVVLVDVSRLRHVNDSLGRGAGDELLVEAGRRLALGIEERDTLARLEGSVFAILVTEPADESEFAAWLERAVFAPLNAPLTLRGTEVRIAARVGVALFPSDATGADDLLRNAEAAVAMAKTSGQRFLFYAPSMNARVGERLGLETRLRRALENEEFVLHYQPKVELRTGLVVGLEALLRWQDPERGLVPPGEFIGILEETGLILDAGAWVLGQACKQYAAWSQAGLGPPRIAANVSAIQLAQKDFVRGVEHTLELYPAARQGLDLELTESVIMEDLAGNIEKLRALKDLGVAVAIDDFGTGYSSLGYLSRLPIDALKIDRSFVIRMSEDPQDMTIVTTIISLAHSLELKVIAEGVETTEQARFLRLVKCDQIQGYLIGKPQPPAQVQSTFQARIQSWPPPLV